MSYTVLPDQAKDSLLGGFSSKLSTEMSYNATADEEDVWRAYCQKRFRRIWILALITAVIAAFTGTTLAILLIRRPDHLNLSQQQSLQEISYFSPFLDQIEFSIKTVQRNGTLFPEQPPSIFRQDPSPEVDAAWDSMTHVGLLAVTTSDVEKLGKNAEKTARYPSSFGLGPDAHIAQMDIVHQIHCLDSLRRAIHYDYYFKDEYGPRHNATNPPLGFKIHISHCIHILLQNLMCNANLDVLTYNWYKDEFPPFVDFSINRQCRDFEAIMDWHNSNTIIPFGSGNTPKMPEGFEPPDPIPGMGPIVPEAVWFSD